MEKRKAAVEKGIVGVLFILVLVVFSFAERDSKRLNDLYNQPAAGQPITLDYSIYTAQYHDTLPHTAGQD